MDKEMLMSVHGEGVATCLAGILIGATGLPAVPPAALAIWWLGRAPHGAISLLLGGLIALAFRFPVVRAARVARRARAKKS